MTGLVIKNTGSDYMVRTSEGATFMCKIKGNFRIRGIKSTNPIAVGDVVDFDESGYINRLHDRRNYIVRRPTNLSKQLHIIAANIDQALLIVTLKNPDTATTFIDRFLAAAEAYRVPTILVFNKIDLLDEAEMDYLNALMEMYTHIGYKCVKLVAIDNQFDEIRQLLSGKITLLSGNSGVGKSTIINQIVPEAQAKTGEISATHLKGMHTTTYSEMFAVDAQSYIIDTPGVKGFGMFDMEQTEISHYFKDIFELSHQCKFDNCTHTHEPGCAVREALEQGKLAITRYESYLSILEESDAKYR